MVSAVRIVRPPEGEAPLWVRQEWVGLVLPLAKPGRFSGVGAGVLSNPHLDTHEDFVEARAAGTARRMKGYVVDADAAFIVLAVTSPEAAAWWRENAPHMRGQRFMFDAAACEPVDGPD